MISVTPPRAAPAELALRRARSRGMRRIDPFGAGVLLFGVIGFVAVLVLFKPGPAPTLTSPKLSQVTVAVDPHQPVDKHEDPEREDQ